MSTGQEEHLDSKLENQISEEEIKVKIKIFQLQLKILYKPVLKNWMK